MTFNNSKANDASPQKGSTTPESSKRVPKTKLDADYVYTVARKSNAKRKLNEDDGIEEPSPKKSQFKGSDSKENQQSKEDENIEVVEVIDVEKIEKAEKVERVEKDIKSESKQVRIRPSKFHSKPEPLTVNGKKIGRPRKYPPSATTTPIQNGKVVASTSVEERLTNGVTNGNGISKTNGMSNGKDKLQTPKRDKSANLLSKMIKQKSEGFDEEPVSDNLPDDSEISEFNESSHNESFLENSYFNEEDNFIAENDKKVSQHSNKKPTLMTFIIRALSEHPDGMSGLTDIYEYIRNESNHYRHLKTEWRSSVRNCLSSSRRFMKHPRPINAYKQRGSLWALNPAHPANVPLINCPKDASKFVSRDTPTPSNSFKYDTKRFVYPNSESPMESLNDASNLSVEDTVQSPFTFIQQQPTRKIQISYVNSSNLAQNTPRYTTVSSIGQVIQNGHNGRYSTAPSTQQYVYYYPPKQQVVTKSIESVSYSTGQAEAYEAPITPSANNGQSELARLLSAPSTPQIQSEPSIQIPSNYMTYNYDNLQTVPQNNGHSYGYDEQENYLPKPLISVPEEYVGKDEYERTSQNSVYMQL